MTWWSSLYFALYITFSLWSLTDDVTHRVEPLWHVVLEVVGDICLLVVALSYWLPSLRAVSEPALLPLYIVGVVVFVAQAIRSLRKHVVLDQALPLRGKLFVGISGTLLVALVTAPALVWGFSSAVLGRASA